ncbi:OmpA family protein [Aeromonas cavernicola]|uniref:OmpA-like domain-containing protein n=1 Tax=Aeromonas cavernicola TaxID=1006623 RepID=A0A2H9U5I5_9GAMM|nr:OmpA family protein [Aeromonas cavernicola]PJG59281.1 hypothetical protein CUC53_08245 [Aeromonas cavernicola]
MNLKIAPTLISLMIAATSSSVLAADNWYTGMGMGWAYANKLDNVDGLSFDKETTALNLFGGYRFTDHYAVELGYLYAGKGGVDGIDFKAQGATLSGLARLPLDKMFAVYAEGGAYFNHVNGNSNSDNSVVPLVGIGLTIKLTDLLDLQARSRYLWKLGDEQKTWQSDLFATTFELVMHPYRRSDVAPQPALTPAAPAAVFEAKEPTPTEKNFALSADVLFDFGQATLKPKGSAALNTLYQQIIDLNPKESSTVVIGYSDRIGHDGYNLNISDTRARIVADFLINKGLPASSVKIEGRGEANPITGSQCDSIKDKAQLAVCLAPDRRVEVRVSGLQNVEG